MFDSNESETVQQQKAVLRQKNLQETLKNSTVAIVANPYLMSLDGQASIDFVLSDIR